MADDVIRAPAVASQPAVSIILPSVRPDRITRCIERIISGSDGVDYEIVIVSPLDLPNMLLDISGYERLTFVRESEKRGSCWANTLGWQHAVGKYVFALADDLLITPGTLKTMVEFARPHDSEMFMAGARIFGAPGPGIEWSVYGFYYAFTPFIRRDLVEQIGGFYDPYYRAYWGDPDLALRVWHAGGRVELCEEAWIEVHNALDEVDSQTKQNFQLRDYRAFIRRWHQHYGHKAKSTMFEDINHPITRMPVGLPPEKCARINAMLSSKNWASIERELSVRDNRLISAENIPALLSSWLAQAPQAPPKLAVKMSRWLTSFLISGESLPLTWDEVDPSTAVKAVFEKHLQKMTKDPYWNKEHRKMSPADAARAQIGRFLRMSTPPSPIAVVCGYGGYDIVFHNHSFGARYTSAHDFNLSQLLITSDSLHGIIKSVHEFDESFLPILDWTEVTRAEDYFESVRSSTSSKLSVLDPMPKYPLRLRDQILYDAAGFFLFDHEGDPQLVMSIAPRSTNIIRYGGKFYTWPWSYGGFNIGSALANREQNEVLERSSLAQVLGAFLCGATSSFTASDVELVAEMEDWGKCASLTKRLALAGGTFQKANLREASVALMSALHDRNWPAFEKILEDDDSPYSINEKFMPLLFVGLLGERRNIPPEICGHLCVALASALYGNEYRNPIRGLSRLPDELIVHHRFAWLGAV